LHYRIAIGSARETWAVLLVAEAAGYIGPPHETLRNKFDAVIGTLHKCVFRKTT